jgi:hypothetical protein
MCGSRGQHAIEPLARIGACDRNFFLTPERHEKPKVSNLQPDDEKPLDPAQMRLVAKVRWLMLISGFATVLGIAVVIGLIGYRVFKEEGRAIDVIATLPKGAKVVATAVADDRVAVTVEINGALEIRTFELRSLKAAGRLRFAIEP